jgi:hypothetical protein
MSLFISSVFTYDEDAGNYIQAVETADAQALEPATRKAINNFVIGCKQDGIWTAIKASCILAGARTLSGALVPLVGAAPTNNGFIGIGTDYVRKTGLVGDGSTKYLNSNRAGNADPQNNQHASVFVTAIASGGGSGTAYLGTAGANPTGTTHIIPFSNAIFMRSQASGAQNVGARSTLNFIGLSRNVAASYVARLANVNSTVLQNSQTPITSTYSIHALGTTGYNGDGRLSFYSIGESLDLARLDARVTDLINAFAVTIP